MKKSLTIKDGIAIEDLATLVLYISILSMWYRGLAESRNLGKESRRGVAEGSRRVTDSPL